MWRPFKKPVHIKCRFAPQNDITVQELARMLECLLHSSSIGPIPVHKDVMETEFGRHFKLLD